MQLTVDPKSWGRKVILLLIAKLVDAYTLILLVYVLMTWIPQKQGIIADIDAVLAKICDPYLDIFRKFIPPIGGMVDISPIFAIIALELLVRVLFGIF